MTRIITVSKFGVMEDKENAKTEWRRRTVEFPPGYLDWIEAEAKKHRRSTSAQLTLLIEMIVDQLRAADVKSNPE
jgi:hypothetical protein